MFYITASHTYANSGTYTVTVTVTDNFDSATVPATTTLIVLPSVYGGGAGDKPLGRTRVFGDGWKWHPILGTPGRDRARRRPHDAH